MADKELFGNSEQLDDTISRQAAIKAADSIIERDTSGNNDVVRAMTAWKEYIKALPTVDAIPARHGRWIYHIDDLFPAESTQECDQCHKEQPLTCGDNFCPNCGAKMTGKDGEGRE